MRKFLFIALVLCASLAHAQHSEEVAFNGIVMDVAGKPLKKVKLYVKDPLTYTFSNKRGEFGLTNVNPADTLKLIYKKKSYRIPLDGKKSVRIRLGDEWDAQDAKDLFDRGFDFISRREYTNSSNRLSGEQLRREGYTSIMAALRGKVPGLQIGQQGGFGSVNSTSFQIRGESSMNASRPPLLLVDGVEVTSFDDVNIMDVDYIEVLKDANSYGIRGSSGVIRVFTLKAGN